MLQIFTQLVIQVVAEQLGELAILMILLTIQEPIGNLVILRVLHDGHNTLKVSLIKLTSTLVKVHFSLAADESGVAASTTLYGGQGEHDLLTTINVGVEETQDVLEAAFFGNVNRLQMMDG